MKIGNIFLKTESDKKNDEKAFNILTIILVAVAILCGVSFILNFFENHNKGKFIFRQEQFYERNGHSEPESTPVADDEYIPRKPNCTFWNCFNVYRCGQREQDRINIYVYPFKEYTDIASSKPAAILTKDYYQIIDTVLQSEYYTPNPNEACLFLPTIDLLNQNLVNLKLAGNALVSLDYWDGGENHLIFNMIPGGFPVFNRVLDVNTDKAIILGGGFDSWTYRPGFDISIPVWSPLLNDFDESKLVFDVQREYFLISAQMNMNKEFRNTLQYIGKEYSTDVLCLQACSKQSSSLSSKKIESVRCNSIPSNIVYDYPSILFKGTFCIVARGLRLGQPDFLEILAHNCIPVIVSDNYVLPFEDVIDWSLASIRIRENDLHSIIPKLREISNIKIIELKQQGRWLFRRYFNSLRAITLTALDILNDRVFPHLAKTNYQWNSISNNYRAAHNPLFLPLISPKSQGFTAVILTYDRIESLFTLIQKLAMVSSLQSILVIWNNQRKAPPHLSMFPRIMKPLKVIQTRANKLSNRFFPYDEIETEAILTIDDDIVMLTPDELNFGFEVWCEFPDRIVGFPSRIHLWDNSTNSWRYESEWTNQISMVLTGVAFHHKYWSYLYTNAMPGDIKDWVDEHMNCEDIAMNFLVANITRKPPIKVAPRKKFKCPECTNNEMLSADLNHMMERSACIDRFAQIYGHMPLKSVEFRADPVLYMDNFPEKLKRFNEIGSL